MKQDELLVLITQLRSGTISPPGYKQLKGVISHRVKIRGSSKEDVVMIAIEKICLSKVTPRENEVNLFVRQRITDAYYKAGIADNNPDKVQLQHQVVTVALQDDSMEEIADHHCTDFQEAETRADHYYAFKSSRQPGRQFEAGGELFPPSPENRKGFPF